LGRTGILSTSTASVVYLEVLEPSEVIEDKHLEKTTAGVGSIRWGCSRMPLRLIRRIWFAAYVDVVHKAPIQIQSLDVLG
jgi:hypothetical protein